METNERSVEDRGEESLCVKCDGCYNEKVRGDFTGKCHHVLHQSLWIHAVKDTDDISASEYFQEVEFILLQLLSHIKESFRQKSSQTDQ